MPPQVVRPQFVPLRSLALLILDTADHPRPN